jgi:hypothetical protein
MYVRRPFEFGSIRMPCSHISSLKLLELLLRAKFVGLALESVTITIFRGRDLDTMTWAVI